MKWHKEILIFCLLAMVFVSLCLYFFLPNFQEETKDIFACITSLLFLSYIATDLSKLKTTYKVIFAFLFSLAVYNLMTYVKVYLNCYEYGNYIINYLFCVVIFVMVLIFVRSWKIF